MVVPGSSVSSDLCLYFSVKAELIELLLFKREGGNSLISELLRTRANAAGLLKLDK